MAEPLFSMAPLPPIECGIVPNAMCTLCWAAAIALVYVGDGYGAYDVDGRGDNRTCFCGDICDSIDLVGMEESSEKTKITIN